MKERTFAALLILVILPVLVLPLFGADDLSVYGHIRIPAAGIHAEVCTIGQPGDCCGTLWNGGTVTVNADMSDVQVGDMADLRGLDGEHIVLECISIRIAWPIDSRGDVLVVNGGWVYRFTRI